MHNRKIRQARRTESPGFVRCTPQDRSGRAAAGGDSSHPLKVARGKPPACVRSRCARRNSPVP
jgi:hypothetical protein